MCIITNRPTVFSWQRINLLQVMEDTVTLGNLAYGLKEERNPFLLNVVVMGTPNGKCKLSLTLLQNLACYIILKSVQNPIITTKILVKRE